jgi:hypothetical protein
MRNQCASLGLTLAILLSGCNGTGALPNAALTASPILAVGITPTTVTVSPAATTPITASVGNDFSAKGVTWTLSGVGSLNPATMTPTSVTYTAPAIVATATTATVTATSVVDPTKSASAVITISANLPITITLSPTSATVADGASQAFTATLKNDTTNAGVTWSILPAIGSLSNATSTSVTYTAPPGLPAGITVTLTATSNATITNPPASASATITIPAPTSPASQWVYYNSTGNLVYKTLDTQGDQIMDFSTAGYGSGSIAIPTAGVIANVSPSGSDDTSAIQAAINTVSTGVLNTTTGLRGAVLLAPGNYKISSSLVINASGVVLRGSGSGTSALTSSIITMTAATTPYPMIILGSSTASPTYTSGTSTTITDTYVPAGSLTIDVATTTGLAVGTSIMIQRPATASWISYLDMNPSQIAPGSACSTGTCDWINPSSTAFSTDRVITAISGTKITLDSPMSDSIDSNYLGVGGATVQAFTFPTRISQVGVESLRVIAPVPSITLVPPVASYQLVVTYAVLNGWIRNITAQDPLQAIDIESWGKQITVSSVALTHTVTQTNSAKFEDYYINGATQVLMDTVSDTTDNMYFFSTSSETQGPMVLRNSTFTGNTGIEPHQRWATGLLVENTTIAALPSDTAGQINLWDRGDYGTGQGWAIGWGVAWNTTASSFTIQQPPGSQNWCIGCKGTQVVTAAPGGTTSLTEGAIDSAGVYVFPLSLYQAQLTQRVPGAIAQ